MITDNWKELAQQKIAASAPQDDKAVAEAFAQQAYTVIGNRDREIMRDPYMLGFEVVYHNEENTRLVGVFAFRLPAEIILAPVFYNNGQVKGQDLLYRKGTNRFVPNTEKWVSYLLSRGEAEEGRGVSRRSSQARMNLDLAQLGGSRLKSASEACECGKEECDCEKCDLPKKASGEVDIAQLWKEAMDAWKVTPPEHLFADFLIDTGMQKQAADLAGKFPEWAELLELSGALDKAAWGEQAPAPAAASAPAAPTVPAPEPFTVQNQADPLGQAFGERLQQGGGQAAATNWGLQAGQKAASAVSTTPDTKEVLDQSIKDVTETPAIKEKLEAPIFPATPDAPVPTIAKKADVTLFLEPQADWSENQIQDFYKQGFALMDSRDMKGLTETFEKSDFEQALSSISEPGIHEVRDMGGNTARVIWAPTAECDNDCRPCGSYSERRSRVLGQNYGLLFLDGSDKGAYKAYYSSTAETDLPAFVVDREFDTEDEKAEGQTSVKEGKVYCAWIPSAGRLTSPFAVATLKTQDNVTKINFGTNNSSYSCPRIVLNKELEGTDLGDAEGGPMILGGDVRFFEVKAAISYNGAKGADNISHFSAEPPVEFRPLTVGRLGESLIKSKTASVKLIPVGRGRVDLMLNGRRRAEDLDKAALSLKLAGNLGLSVSDALAYAERGTQEVTEFNLISPRQQVKLAAAYMDLPEEEYLDMVKEANIRAKVMEKLMGIIPKLKARLNAAPTANQQEWIDILSNPKVNKLTTGTMAAGAGGGALLGYGMADFEDWNAKEFPATPPAAAQSAPEPKSETTSTPETADIPQDTSDFSWEKILKHPATIGALVGAGGLGAYQMLRKKKSKKPGAKAEEKDEELTEKEAAFIVELAKEAGMLDDLKDFAENGVDVKGMHISPAAILGGDGAGLGLSLRASKKQEAKEEPRKKKEKEAAAYYDRDIDPDEEFEDRDYDQDLDIPVYSPEDNQAIVEFRRQQQVSPQQNYLDAMGQGGPRNKRHGTPQFIPDELIMQMRNPVEEMAQLGQQMGLKSLMDHGAVGSMTKIFDAAPHIKKYVGQLEASLDFMARLLFMLFWKPKDFADIFGSDDIPNMENKLTGVFLAYGDLVLELKQSAGDDDQEIPDSM